MLLDQSFPFLVRRPTFALEHDTDHTFWIDILKAHRTADLYQAYHLYNLEILNTDLQELFKDQLLVSFVSFCSLYIRWILICHRIVVIQSTLAKPYLFSCTTCLSLSLLLSQRLATESLTHRGNLKSSFSAVTLDLHLEKSLLVRSIPQLR